MTWASSLLGRQASTQTFVFSSETATMHVSKVFVRGRLSHVAAVKQVATRRARS